MRERTLSLPVLGLIGVTRGMIGFGAGLLLSGKIDKDYRNTVGLALLSAGLLSTIPLAIHVLKQRNAEELRTADKPKTQAAPSMMH